MKRWLHAGGAIVSVLCLAFFLRAVGKHWQMLQQMPWTMGIIVSLCAATGLYLATFASATGAWQFGLRLFGLQPGFRELARILMSSQIAKYLPGNVGHHVGRVVLARRIGLPADAVVASMVLDTGLVLVAGAVCSLPALAVLLDAAGRHPSTAWRSLAIACALALLVLAALLASPALRGRVSAWHSRVPAWRTASRWLGGALACHAASFVAGATALFLLCLGLASAMGTPAGGHWLAVLGIYAAAWLLGFLMPGSPAGLGVRELVLLLGLAPVFGEQLATTAAALLRLVTTSGDGIAFLFASRTAAPPGVRSSTPNPTNLREP